LIAAVTTVYNFNDKFIGTIAESALKQLGRTSTFPNPTSPTTSSQIVTLNLNALSVHGIIEHDASLTRLDYAQGDNHSIQQELVEGLLNSSSTDSIGIEELALFRNQRLRDSKAAGQKALGIKQTVLANGESAFLLQAMGIFGPDGKPRIPKAYIQSWLGQEKLPDGYNATNNISSGSTTKIALQVTQAQSISKGDYLLQTLADVKRQGTGQTAEFYSYLAAQDMLYINKDLISDMAHKKWSSKDSDGGEGNGLLKPGLPPPFHRFV
jgi:hypothetical protein